MLFRSDRGGTKVKVDVPESDWLTLEQPALRIISDELWAAVHARLAQTKRNYLRGTGGKLWGRPDTESKYLLSGFATCALCGGTLFVRNRPDGKTPGREARGYYGCMRYHLRGLRACGNRLQLHMSSADTAVLAASAPACHRPDRRTLRRRPGGSRGSARSPPG